jgi:GNAT superfamily N-acetyltransferase
MADSGRADATLRPLDPADLEQAHGLSTEAGWPQRIEDWSFVLKLGKAYGAYCGSARLVGTALWWPYDDRHAATGMVIVSRAARGRGIGRRLMQTVLDNVGTRSITLNATQDGESLYRSLGFRATGTVRQHQGFARSLDYLPLAENERLVPVGEDDISRLLELDRAATGIERSGVLRPLYQAASSVALVRSDAIVGFSFLRAFGRGQLIGPVVAPDCRAAMVLIDYWLARTAGVFVRIDTPARDEDLAARLSRSGLSPVDTVTTMWRGAVAQVGTGAGVFALINQALG